MEIINTQELKRLDYEKTGDTAVILTFQGIYGVGMWHILYPDASDL
jgi:hypothetical protein